MTKATIHGLGASAESEFTIKNMLKVGASLAVLGGMLAGQTAMAQDTSSQDETETAGQQDPEADTTIYVSGIRRSLESAQNLKRDADTVVDAITAEDIGALPDRSVTEALQRVPGVAINRFAGSNDPDHFSVEGSGVVVRGLNYVRSEFNGRTAFVAGVGGQALNFADVPAELLGSVIISKNATADLIEGGLAGTVNLVTRKPFDRYGLQLGLSAELNYGDFSEEYTPTLSGLISNTWETEIGTFGILASASYSQVRARADGLQITNFQTRDGTLVNAANAGGVQVCRNPLPSGSDSFTLPPPGSACGNSGTAGADGFADYADVRYAPLGAQFRTQDFDRRRTGLALAAQYETPDGGTVVTAEFIRSHATQEWGEYTFETAPDLAEYGTYPVGCQQNANGPNLVNTDGSLGDGTTRAQCPVGGFTDYQYDGNGLFQSGYITNPNDGWRGDPGTSPFVPIGGIQQQLSRRQVDEETTNQDWGLNINSQLTDRLNLELDFQYAESRKENLDFTIFGANFADQELDLTGDLPIATPRKPNILAYSWAGPTVADANATRPELNNATEAEYFSDPRFQFWRAAMDHIEDSEGEQYALRADLGYEFADDSFLREVKLGARYQDRDQTVRYTTYNWGVLSEVWAGSSPVSFADTNPYRSQYYDFPNFFRGDAPGPQGAFYYGGDLTGNYQGSVDFARSVNEQWVANGGSAGFQPLAARAGADGPYIPSDIQPVAQEDIAAYAMIRFGSDDIGGMRFAGNAGLRYVTTDVTSSGQIGVGTQQQFNIVDPFSTRCALTVPPGAPPGTPPTSPGGVCDLGQGNYEALQQFADGSTFESIAETSYDYWLPSLNLRIEPADDVILRFAASRVLTRPDNGFIRNFLNLSLDGAGNLTAQAGNPFIRPATAWQFDLTAEWYFAAVGSLTINGFYKDISDFFYQDLSTRQITNNGVTRDVLVRGPANFDGNGKIKGFEVAYQQTYDFLPGPLGGLGVAANYTFIDSSGLPNSFLNGGELANESTVPTGNLPLEQLSRHNVNATVFYEQGPISARAAYNWRSRFLLTATDVIFPYYSIFNEPTGQLDASIFVNLSESVRVGVQGVNLLNEVTRTTQAYTGNPDDLAPRSYFINDRRYALVLRANF